MDSTPIWLKALVRGAYRAILRWIFAGRMALTAGVRTQLLLIRTDAIGDFVLFTPVLQYIRRAFPETRISMVVSESVAPIARTCPYLDEVLIWDRGRYRWDIAYRFRFLKKLRAQRFQTAIYPVRSRESYGDEILYCSGASEKIGIAGSLNNIAKEEQCRNDRFFTRLISDPNQASELEFNREVAVQLTGFRIASEEFQPKLWLKDSESSASRAMLRGNGISLGKDADTVVALFPGAGWNGREWPNDRYAKIADQLIVAYGAKIVILGSAQDIGVIAAVQSKMKGPSSNFAGKLALEQLGALLRECSFFIGNETGPLHMAVAVGIPTLGIMGGGHFGRFYPYGDLNKHRMAFKQMDCYGCNWNCIYDTTRCIQEISVDDVWRETRRMMEEVVLPSRGRRDTELCNDVTLP